jgi:hypothetical protein
MAITRYAGDRFYGLDSEKSTLILQVMDGAQYIASDTRISYTKINGAWLKDAGIYASGAGISGRLTKFVSSDQITNTDAPVWESGANIGFGVPAPKEFIDVSGNALIRGQIIEGVSFQTIGSAVGTGLYLNLDSGNVHVITITGNITGVRFNNPSEGYCTAFTLQINQSGAGSNTLSWAGPVIKWAGGSSQAPAITATTGRTDTFGFITTDGGSSYFGFIVAQNSYV